MRKDCASLVQTGKGMDFIIIIPARIRLIV